VDAFGSAIEQAEFPGVAGGDCAVEPSGGRVEPAIEGDEFDGELGEAFTEVGVFRFDDDEILGCGDEVIDVAFEAIVNLNRIFDFEWGLDEFANGRISLSRAS